METANFFRQIAQMEMNSNLTLSITKATTDTIIVSIFIDNDSCPDKARNIIPPFNVTGTPEELDLGFFEHIKKPVKRADGLISNMESFLKQVDKAEANSSMKRGNTDKSKKEIDPKEKRYRDAMEKAEQLEREEKFTHAWSALPKASDYPQYKEIIAQKKEMYERKFAPSFFDEEKESGQNSLHEDFAEPIEEFQQDDQEDFRDD